MVARIISIKDRIIERLKSTNPERYREIKIQEATFEVWEAWAKVLGDLKVFKTQVTVFVNGRKWTFSVVSEKQ